MAKSGWFISALYLFDGLSNRLIIQQDPLHRKFVEDLVKGVVN